MVGVGCSQQRNDPCIRGNGKDHGTACIIQFEIESAARYPSFIFLLFTPPFPLARQFFHIPYAFCAVRKVVVRLRITSERNSDLFPVGKLLSRFTLPDLASTVTTAIYALFIGSYAPFLPGFPFSALGPLHGMLQLLYLKNIFN